MTGRRATPTFSGAEQSMLLGRLQAIDFAIQDTVLYLDAYPEDKDAIDYYHSLLDTRAGIVDLISPSHPMTVYDNMRDTWDWVTNPWPWEPEAN